MPLDTMQASLSHPAASQVHAQQPAEVDQAGHAGAWLQELSVESSQLLRGKKSISIVHNGAVYRLQSTKLGKLILTK